MIHALNNATESSLADLLDNLVSIADLVASFESVVPFLVVKSIVDKSLKLCGLVLLFFAGDIPHFIKFLDLLLLE